MTDKIRIDFPPLSLLLEMEKCGVHIEKDDWIQFLLSFTCLPFFLLFVSFGMKLITEEGQRIKLFWNEDVLLWVEEALWFMKDKD